MAVALSFLSLECFLVYLKHYLMTLICDDHVLAYGRTIADERNCGEIIWASVRILKVSNLIKSYFTGEDAMNSQPDRGPEELLK